MMNIFGHGRIPEPESVRCCVLYDPADGRVVHYHEVVDFPGCHKATDTEVESKTFRMAAKAGHNASNLKSLHLPGAFPNDKAYSVDPSSRQLVEAAKK
jgi:hypothetical protein